MRKLSWRLICLVLILIPLFSTLSLILTAVNSLFHKASPNCLPEKITTVKGLSTIPPHYLLVPYREFVFRTSISCQTFTIDEPKNDVANFHPKFSSYLKGNFSFVIPHKNITFDDIEHFYTSILPNSSNQTKPISLPFAPAITFDYIPYEYKNHLWSPIGVIPAQRAAILIPLQGRDYNAKTFILNIHAFARRQQLSYMILLIEQVTPVGHRFNKGRLFNTGFNYLQKMRINITCLVLHDVDLIPENDHNFYTCESKYPKHTTSRVRQIDNNRGYNRFYEFLIGGVLLVDPNMYTSFNGFSNMYWGWGGEDDDLSLRLIQRRICVVRPNYQVSLYAALPHPRGQRNNARFNLLTWATVRINSDGYAQIGSLTRIVQVIESLTVTHLRVDVNMDHSFYDPPSFEKVAPFLKKQNIKETEQLKAINSNTPTSKPKTEEQKTGQRARNMTS